jgi:hypothetical protein
MQYGPLYQFAGAFQIQPAVSFAGEFARPFIQNEINGDIAFIDQHIRFVARHGGTVSHFVDAILRRGQIAGLEVCLSGNQVSFS